MSKWLYLGPSREQRWVNLLSKGGEVVEWMERAPETEDLQSVDLVLETHVNEAIKKEVLRGIAACGGWNGYVVSLISGNSATALATESGLGNRFAGFYAYPNQGELILIELLYNDITHVEALEEVKTFFEKLGLTVSLCRDQAGGILGRILSSMINEASYMLLYGVADMEKIDRMMKLGANFPMGPFEWADTIGLDKVFGVLVRMTQELGPQYQPCPLIRRKVEAGFLGIKTGRGFYNYKEKGARL